MQKSETPARYGASRPRLAAVLVVAVLASATPRAHASGTDPSLALTQAEAHASAAGVVGLDVRGSFEVDDHVQFDFPAGVLVWKGADWGRFELGGASFVGTEPGLGNGVSEAEMKTLAGAGAPAVLPARVTRAEPGRMQLVLPEALQSGVVSVVAYAILEDTAYLSNVLTVNLP